MAEQGLYANIHAKRKRIANGSGETMRRKGEEGAPTEANFKKAAKTAKSQSYDVPKAVRAAANKGLELRLKYGRGGLSTQEAGEQRIGSGVARARDLAKGRVSLETVKRMRGFFARHKKNKAWGDGDEPSNGYIAWQLWGGDAGQRWVNSAQFDDI